MTEQARIRRDYRHYNEKELITVLHQTRFGKGATVPQVKAAARKILHNYTAKFMLTK